MIARKWTLILLLVCLAPAAYAADTVETYDAGAVDFEFFLGGDGLNLDKYEKSVFGNVLVGYGFLPRFSGYIALGATADEYLTYGESGYSFGLFGTPLDTSHVDLDLMLDIGMGGEGLGEMGVTPGFELNVDLMPDLELWGVYVRIEDSLVGRDDSVMDDPETADVNEEEQEYTLTGAVGQTYGTYFSVADIHQLFLEYSQTYYTDPLPEELENDIDGFALGYNVMLTDNLELSTQISYHPEQDEQDEAWGACIGIIVAPVPAAEGE